MIQTCYMCEKEATSKEHVPPKSIFPKEKDLRKNLITVPSCDEHNSSKSLDDEYLAFILSSSHQGNKYNQKHFETKVIRAVKRRPHVYESFLKNHKTIYTGGQSSEYIQSDLNRFNSSVFHMACGLFYHHYKNKWLGGFKVLNNLFVDMSSQNAPEINQIIQDANKQISNDFKSKTSLGENKEIFKYNMISDNRNSYAVHMVFYENIKVTVLLR